MDRRIRKLVELPEQDSRLTLHEVAQLLDLSTSRTRHLFSEATGTNLRRFLLHRRLQAAAKLLANTNLAVKEVAFLAGYCHVPSFSRAVRRHFGVSPTVLRSRIG